MDIMLSKLRCDRPWLALVLSRAERYRYRISRAVQTQPYPTIP